MSRLTRIVLAAQIAMASYAVPFISPQGVIGSAGFLSPSLPNGGIAQGAIFSIFGRELGPTQGAQASSFPLAEELAEVRITVTQGEISVQAIPVFVRADQINAILPSNAPLGRVIIRVSFSGIESNGIPAIVVASRVGLFTVNSSGYGPGVVQNVAADGARTLNSPQESAKPGQLVILWGVGLGAVEGGDNVPPTPGNLGVEIEVYIGGVRVADEGVRYAGRSSCCAGLDQFVIELPAGAPPGCYVPVEIRTAAGLMSNAVTMSIADEAGACIARASPFGDAFVDPGRVGLIQLIRLSLFSTLDRPGDLSGLADFSFSVLTDQREAGPFFFNAMVSLPPPGTCLTASGTALDALAFSPALRLDGGSTLAIAGPGGARMATLNSVAPDVLGGSVPDLGFASPFLRAGSYRVSSEGGAGVGEFEVDLAVPDLPTWLNRDDVDIVDRSQPLRFDWQLAGADDEVVAVLLLARTGGYRAHAAVLCIEEGSVGSLSIPSRNLMSLPPSSAKAFSDRVVVLLASAPVGLPLEAAGLEAGVAVGIGVVGKEVVLE